jgi:hypothetical protein
MADGAVYACMYMFVCVCVCVSCVRLPESGSELEGEVGSSDEEGHKQRQVVEEDRQEEEQLQRMEGDCMKGKERNRPLVQEEQEQGQAQRHRPETGTQLRGLTVRSCSTADSTTWRCHRSPQSVQKKEEQQMKKGEEAVTEQEDKRETEQGTTIESTRRM